jgi:CHAD domain-containing protein
MTLLEITNSPANVDPESIHVLRVELKRVRFLAGLIKRYVPKAKLKKAYRPFKTLFKAAGELRGEQVNIYRKEQSEHGDEVTLHRGTTKKIQKLGRKFAELLIRQRKKIRKGMSRLTAAMEKFPSLSQQMFVDELTTQLLNNLTPETPKKELHQNRHRLKGILYSAEIAPSVSALIKKRFDLNHILKLEDAIGDWHDLTILLHRARKGGVLSPQGVKAARKKKQEKLQFAYEAIAQLHTH